MIIRMQQARPRLTLKIEQWLDEYNAWMDERFWHILVSPRIVLPLLLIMMMPPMRLYLGCCVGAALLYFVWRLLSARNDRQMVEKIQNHICLECGYDLRATPLRCPECGTPAPMQHLAVQRLRVGLPGVHETITGGFVSPSPGNPGEGWGGGSRADRNPLPNPPPDYRERE